MQIESKKIILRKMIVADIDDVIYWNSEATEWMNWDAPWERDEDEAYDWEAYRKRKLEEIITNKEEDSLQMSLEVCINNEEQTHIGGVACYFINDEYRIDEKGKKIAIGMVINEEKYRGYGYGKESFLTYIHYLQSLGYEEIYTQTWSGNIPMIKMAENLGFKECNRYVDLREVRGKRYDGLTFVMK